MLRKTVHRPNHRERAQPIEREKWGILEKHKDYSLRARDFQEKKKRLQALRQKAVERNPDEFRYGMLSSHSKRGKKIAKRGNPVLSHEVVKLLKTQDAGYLRTILQKTRRNIEKLEQEFIIKGEEGPMVLSGLEEQEASKHVIFVNSGKEQKQFMLGRSLLARSDFKTTTTDARKEQLKGEDERIPKSRRARQRAMEASKQEQILRKQHTKEQNSRQAKLLALKTREKDLVVAENELELQRAKMSNSIGGVTRAGVKWQPRGRKK